MVFTVLPVGHAAAGATAVVRCAVAGCTAEGPGRHRYRGRVYLVAVGVVSVTVTGMSTLRRSQDVGLLILAWVAVGSAVLGVARRRRGPRRLAGHIMGMACTCIGPLTGFVVDKAPTYRAETSCKRG